MEHMMNIDEHRKRADDLSNAVKLLASLTGDKKLDTIIEITETIERIGGKLLDIAHSSVKSENPCGQLSFLAAVELLTDNYIKGGQ